ncbi:aminodeoxychorismate/anthranilate synthase component II [Aliikangiella coralliicola]|uniref:anthranilate synthase n=1 Tax=Aliikangiella coralliicola TaxID=2592383 RepID=A0A545TWE6_9GAMM|nr:aminodeoxychorismate/anthranilate synthase component II [Aliikangiella coralliicola]TQV81545.1 aminodeoxychorismate/anthranilate synthase component II [Aliikangiella coralliicola]
MTQPLQIIMIDNYDSFTYNLVNQFRMLNVEVVVFRNDTPIDEIFTEQRLQNKRSVIVISPGPGNPDSAGNSLKIIEQFSGKLPILGICLGHQAIVQQFGGVVGQARDIVHGKADDIHTEEHPVFNALPNPLRAARYHSLVATQMPTNLDVIAKTEHEVMAVKHQQHKILGFQFHPESILTTYGGELLKSSLSWLADAPLGQANHQPTNA